MERYSPCGGRAGDGEPLGRLARPTGQDGGATGRNTPKARESRH